MSWQFLHGLATSQPVAVEYADAIIISAPHWFERADFRTWRQNSTACWHPELRDGGDYADVFMTFDRGDNSSIQHDWEGSDSYDLPMDIYWEIGRQLAKAGLRYGLIWIKPV